MKTQITLFLAVGMGLSACGGGDEPIDTGPELARLYSAQAMTDRLSYQSPTLFLPTTGTAAYEGYAAGLVETASAGDLSIVGDMSMTVNFAADTLTGSADNFIAATDSGGLFTMSGSLDMDNGKIGTGSAFTLTVNGNLNGGGYRLVFDDGAEGTFVGSSASGLLFATDEFGTVLINGVERAGAIGGIAEQ